MKSQPLKFNENQIKTWIEYEHSFKQPILNLMDPKMNSMEIHNKLSISKSIPHDEIAMEKSWPVMMHNGAIYLGGWKNSMKNGGGT